MSSAMTAALLLPNTKAEVSPAACRTATASRLCWLISKFCGLFIVLRALLGEAAFDYVAGGAEERNLEMSVLGTPSAALFLLAPVGVQSIVHPEAEVAVARAAAAMGIPFILSTVSSTTIEEVSAAVQGKIPVLMSRAQ